MNKGLEEQEIKRQLEYFIANATPYQVMQIINRLLQDLNKNECYVLDAENPDCYLKELEYDKAIDTFYCYFNNCLKEEISWKN